MSEAGVHRWQAPKIVGIVNLTEDSFSDGGLYLEPAAAVEHARALLADGADVIELGPASSHPDAHPVSDAEERRRLEPVLDALQGDGTAISIDSCKASTQRLALERGVAYINDVLGFPDESVYPSLASSSCRLVVMHGMTAGERAVRERSDPGVIWDRIFSFFDSRVENLTGAGVAADRLILDPGLGFFLGDTPGPSLAVLSAIGRLGQRYRLPVMVSASRKSFLQNIVGRGAGSTGAATLAAELYAALSGVDFIRTHDVGALHDAMRVIEALKRAEERSDEEPVT